MGLELSVFASWFLLSPHKFLTEGDNVVSVCFRLGDECHCGVFRNTMSEEPIISHSSSFVLPCDKEGRESCKTMCTALVSVCQHSVLFIAALHHSQERAKLHLCVHHTPLWCRQKFSCLLPARSNFKFVCR
jgi:hypothetical protein